ncbi:MAG: cupredoxin domain-containing protein [Polyangiaceae bacterium]|jgi:plastocyanin domain-containing protein|nr:cupredoxin domain-containing protein [Polyangiaceae bacterium]
MRPWSVLLLVSSALVASACKKPATESSPPAYVAAPGDVMIVADDKGFTPSKVEVAKGKSTRLVFKRTSDGTCATDVVFPELSVKRPLPLNQPVAIEIPVGEARTYAFQCGMGMYKSAVVVQ